MRNERPSPPFSCVLAAFKDYSCLGLCRVLDMTSRPTGSNVPSLPQAPLRAGTDRGMVFRPSFREAEVETRRQENRQSRKASSIHGHEERQVSADKVRRSPGMLPVVCDLWMQCWRYFCGLRPPPLTLLLCARRCKPDLRRFATPEVSFEGAQCCLPPASFQAEGGL